MFSSASAPPSVLRSSRTEHPQLQRRKGWAKTNRRSGPSQVAEVNTGRSRSAHAEDCGVLIPDRCRLRMVTPTHPTCGVCLGRASDLSALLTRNAAPRNRLRLRTLHSYYHPQSPPSPIPTPEVHFISAHDGINVSGSGIPSERSKHLPLASASPYRFDTNGLPAVPRFMFRETASIRFYLSGGYAHSISRCAAQAVPKGCSSL